MRKKKWIPELIIALILVIWSWRLHVTPWDPVLPGQHIVSSKVMIAIFFSLFLVYVLTELDSVAKVTFVHRKLLPPVLLILLSILLMFFENMVNINFYFPFFQKRLQHLSSFLAMVGIMWVIYYGIFLYVSYFRFKKTGIPNGIMLEIINDIDQIRGEVE